MSKVPGTYIRIALKHNECWGFDVYVNSLDMLRLFVCHGGSCRLTIGMCGGFCVPFMFCVPAEPAAPVESVSAEGSNAAAVREQLKKLSQEADKLAGSWHLTVGTCGDSHVCFVCPQGQQVARPGLTTRPPCMTSLVTLA